MMEYKFYYNHSQTDIEDIYKNNNIYLKSMSLHLNEMNSNDQVAIESVKRLGFEYEIENDENKFPSIDIVRKHDQLLDYVQIIRLVKEI